MIRRALLMAMLLILPAAALAEGLTVAVSVLPLKRFVERVAGDRARVIVLVGPGQSPATYEPTPRQMAALARVDILFPVGVPFERIWLPRIEAANPGLVVTDLSAGIKRRAMTGDHHGHDHGELDPHVWTNPVYAGLMVDRIVVALSELDPEGAERYQANAARYLRTLAELDSEIRTLLDPARGKCFLVFHPAWGYFAEAYGLEQVAIEAEGKSPGAKSLRAVIKGARAKGVEAVFVQEQFAASAARAVADALGAELIAVDPLAEDYAQNLRRVARAFAEALR